MHAALDQFLREEMGMERSLADIAMGYLNYQGGEEEDEDEGDYDTGRGPGDDADSDDDS
jgi:hypothetical protein